MSQTPTAPGLTKVQLAQVQFPIPAPPPPPLPFDVVNVAVLFFGSPPADDVRIFVLFGFFNENAFLPERECCCCCGLVNESRSLDEAKDLLRLADTGNVDEGAVIPMRSGGGRTQSTNLS